MYTPSSTFKHALKTLHRGDQITATGVAGDFILPKDATIPLLFIAGGIGITPFMSHVLDIEHRKQPRDITLIYIVNDIDDAAYIDEMRSSGIRVIVVTKTNQPITIKGWTHHNESRITTNDLIGYIPDLGRRHVYISGPPLMVDAMRRMLKESQVKHIKTDYFTGY